MICDRQSSSTVLWIPAEFSSVTNTAEKLVTSFTVSIMPRLRQEEQIQGQCSSGL